MLTEKEKKWLKKHGIYFTNIDIFDVTVLLIVGEGLDKDYDILLERIESYLNIDLKFLREEPLVGGSVFRISRERLIDIVLLKQPDLALLVHELMHTVQHIFNHFGFFMVDNKEGKELSAYLLEYLFKEFSPYLLTKS